MQLCYDTAKKFYRRIRLYDRVMLIRYLFLYDHVMLIVDLPLHLFKNKAAKYTDPQREFAVTLHFYSPKAYDYMSKHFPLPSVRTLRGLAPRVHPYIT